MENAVDVKNERPSVMSAFGVGFILMLMLVTVPVAVTVYFSPLHEKMQWEQRVTFVYGLGIGILVALIGGIVFAMKFGMEGAKVERKENVTLERRKARLAEQERERRKADKEEEEEEEEDEEEEEEEEDEEEEEEEEEDEEEEEEEEEDEEEEEEEEEDEEEEEEKEK